MVVPLYGFIAISQGATPWDSGGHLLVTTLAGQDADNTNAWMEAQLAFAGASESQAGPLGPIDTFNIGGAAVLDGQRLAFVTVSAPTEGDGSAQIVLWYSIEDAPTDPA